MYIVCNFPQLKRHITIFPGTYKGFHVRLRHVVLCGLLILAACSVVHPEPHFTVDVTMDENGEFLDVIIDTDLPDSHIVEVSINRWYTEIWNILGKEDTLPGLQAYFEGALPVHEWRTGQRIHLSTYNWLYENGGPLDDPPSYRELYSIRDSIEVWAFRPETHGVQNAQSLKYLYAADDTTLISVVDWWP